MTAYTDRQLVELAQRRDPAAIGELFARYWRAARAAAFGVTGDIASAEDAAAEAFTEALMRIQSLRDPDRFGAWLRTIVVRGARHATQGREASIDGVAEHREALDETPERALERRELTLLLQHTACDLPEALREAVALVYFEGYESEAAARFLDIPPGTLRRRLHDGRLQLRRAVQRVLRQDPSSREERRHRIDRQLARLSNGDDIYQVVREALALRPVPQKLIHSIIRRRLTASAAVDRGTVGTGAAPIGEMARHFAMPSDRVRNPAHPVGDVAAAIEGALPTFQPWPLDIGEAAARYFKEADARLQPPLPPGFAEGRSGAFRRRSRALLFLNADASVCSVYEHLQRSADERAFRGARPHARLSDAIDLVWMVAGTLELRAVQALLEEVITDVVPGTRSRFSPYEEPRYRAALQLHLGSVTARAAYGGVLGEWPGSPRGASAAHLRLLLEPWATIRSGQPVEFDPAPEPPAPGPAGAGP